MENDGSELQEELDLLAAAVRTTEKNFNDFNNRHFNGLKEEIVIHCIKRSGDLGNGCLIAAKTKLPQSLYILTRGLFETLIHINWVIVSDENAKTFADLTLNEVKRTGRNSMNRGFAHITNRETGEDVTKEAIDLYFSDLSRRPTLENMAKAAGLERLYVVFYGFLSIQSHGYTFSLSLPFETVDDELMLAVASAKSLVQAINLVAETWIVRRKKTSTNDIYDILVM
ncbi:MAG: DUF5677 domain-containing protein [Anaerolineae bacterium]|nr:DUF5677 domain-containing protein [Anaerolineae bacterium]